MTSQWCGRSFMHDIIVVWEELQVFINPLIRLQVTLCDPDHLDTVCKATVRRLLLVVVVVVVVVLRLVVEVVLLLKSQMSC